MEFTHRALIDAPVVGTTSVLVISSSRELDPEGEYTGLSIPDKIPYPFRDTEVLESCLIPL